MTDNELMKKYETLKEHLKALGSAGIAFSGGVDSAFLLFAAKEALGDRACAFTVASCLNPEKEENEAAAFCAEHGIRQTVVRVDPLAIEGLKENPPDRCYLCKKDLFGRLTKEVKKQGLRVLIEGSNTDDTGDYRPGRRAIKELGVRSPLLECGLSKREIRALSEHFSLPTWNKPSMACLASRLPYGEEITEEKLRMVDAAERFLQELDFTQLRVRFHGGAGGTTARIELPPEDMTRFMEEEIRLSVCDAFRKIGFAYCALDLKGYRTGSMNEVLQ